MASNESYGSVFTLYCKAVRTLTAAGSSTSAADAMELLRFVWPEAPFESAPAAPDCDHFAALIGARAAGMPVEYLTGRTVFRGNVFHVTPDVLVPRERTTSILVDVAHRALVHAVERHQGDSVILADIGVGCGAVLLTLLDLVPHPGVRGIGVDRSSQALQVARDNAGRLGLAGRVEWVQSDLVRAIRGPVDLVVANLPYVAEPRPQLSFEPDIALRGGGQDGLDLFGALLGDLARVVAVGGVSCLEIPPSRADRALARARAHFDEVVLACDASGVPRALTVHHPGGFGRTA